MYSEKLVKEIKTKHSQIEVLKDEVYKSIYHLYGCAHFNNDAICKILADLASIYEDKNYVPVKFRTQPKQNYKYCDDYYVIDASKRDTYKELQDIDTLTYEDGFVVGSSLFNKSDEENNEHIIEMGFLIDRINNKLNLPYDYRIIQDINKIYYYIYSLTSFSGREYIKDFIIHLFDLQVENNGKQLTYEEMQVALNDFLELEKDKPKLKIKEKDNK